MRRVGALEGKLVDKLLNPEGASQYLKERGVDYSKATLKKLRVIGGGPLFHRFGPRMIRYTPPALDAFIEEKLSPPLHSTSHDHRSANEQECESTT